MNISIFKYYIIISISLLMASACSLTKKLDESDFLYTGTHIELENDSLLFRKKALKSELETLAEPPVNTGLLKLRLRLHNALKEPKKQKGVRYWLKYKLGEKPALYQDELINRTRLRMDKYLHDKGYFSSTIKVDTTQRKRKISATYTINTIGPYSIRKIELPSDSTALGRLFKRGKRIIKEGTFYDKQQLDEERERLTTLANNSGYLEFTSAHIYYYVDTIPNQLLADIYITIKPPSDSTTHQQYYLKNTKVYTNYDLNVAQEAIADTMISNKKMRIFQEEKILRPKILKQMILQNPNDLYSKELADASINHLLDLGIFKFVNLEYVPNNSRDTIGFDRFFYLTPDRMEHISTELELNNRTGNFFGTAASVRYTHKNLFRGAEQFEINLTGGVETQLNMPSDFINTADLDLSMSLALARFLVPFPIKTYSTYYVPRTIINVGNNFQRRNRYYTINSTNLTFGYKWRETKQKWHEFNPISLNRIQVFNTTVEFDSLLLTNQRLRRSFSNRFIGGMTYTFRYVSPDQAIKKSTLFFRGEAEIAGNVFQLIASNISNNPKETYNFLGLPFSQYVKLHTDIRFFRFFKHSKLAFRLAPGLGIAYGNSTILPYIKQFHVGGANSIRAFNIRQLGPGTFVAADNKSSDFLDQTGDIKLEFTAEYRFDLFSYLKGALFLDAGNIWLLPRKEVSNIEGVFRWDDFYKEIAIGTGVGIRLDLDFFVIRLDGAFPLRKAYANRAFEWTFDKLQFGNRAWRTENIVWNIAIGYPF